MSSAVPAAAQSAAPSRAASPYRAFEVEVARARRLSPSFLRMTFTGPDLDEFAAVGLDQRIKLVLPAACGARVDVRQFAADDWYTSWRQKPDDEREPLRTYTVRAVRPADREVDVDVVLHGVSPGGVTTRGCGLAELLGCACSAKEGAGPAVRWCAAARQGDPIVLIGPDAGWSGPPTGIEWRPPADATRFLLAGDETAAPAICSILEQLPADAVGQAFVEVPTRHDALDVRVPAGFELNWLPRTESPSAAPYAVHGELLEEAVRREARRLVAAQHAGVDPGEVDVDSAILWEVPDEAAAPNGLYAWVAGEAAVVRSIRRHLVRDVGVDRRAVAFMGYWRAGRPEGA